MFQLKEGGSTLIECIIGATLFLALLSEPIALLASQLKMTRTWHYAEAEIESLWRQRILSDTGFGELHNCTFVDGVKTCELQSAHPLLQKHLTFTGWKENLP